MAEFRAEDVGMDIEDDVDFIVEKGGYIASYIYMTAHRYSFPQV